VTKRLTENAVNAENVLQHLQYHVASVLAVNEVVLRAEGAVTSSNTTSLTSSSSSLKTFNRFCDQQNSAGTHGRASERAMEKRTLTCCRSGSASTDMYCLDSQLLNRMGR
jgi:hypothetical protein